MKRFLLFGGDHYYPRGGWNDYQGSFETVEKIYKFIAEGNGQDWHYILDTQTMIYKILKF